VGQKIILPTDLTGKNVLVAGAAGFVPSTLCELYLNLGANLVGLDNFITGSKSNIELLSKFKNFEFIECDISKGLPDFKDIKFDYVFSLASPASPIDFKVIPLEIMEVNSVGTKHLLELSKDHGSRFLEASTSEVYGDPEIHPQVEEYVGCVNPIGIRSPYDESKRFAEALTMTYHRRYNVDTRIVRIFNTYGPRMRPDDGRVIPNFINQALKGENITIYGDGSQTRSFSFVTDTVQAIHNVMFSDIHTPFNCGNPDEYTIKEAAEFIIKVLGSSSTLSYHPLPEDDPKKRRPNMNKLMSISDFSPKVGFEEGLLQTATFFKEML
jgi:dTDP-glucose 4,6-dehydratase